MKHILPCWLLELGLFLDFFLMSWRAPYTYCAVQPSFLGSGRRHMTSNDDESSNKKWWRRKVVESLPSRWACYTAQSIAGMYGMWSEWLGCSLPSKPPAPHAVRFSTALCSVTCSRTRQAFLYLRTSSFCIGTYSVIWRHISPTRAQEARLYGTICLVSASNANE